MQVITLRAKRHVRCAPQTLSFCPEDMPMRDPYMRGGATVQLSDTRLRSHAVQITSKREIKYLQSSA